MLQRLGGTLTAPAAGDPEAIALRYVRQALPTLDLATLQAPTSTTADGVTMLRWRQAVDGVPSADSELRVNVTADGRVLSVLGDPASDLRAGTPALSAGEAVRAAQDDLGAVRPLARAAGPVGATRTTTYGDGTSARLALLRGRLTWRVHYRESSTAVWDMFVDATAGKVLKRANLVKSEAPANVWDNHPGTGPGGTAGIVDLEGHGWIGAGATSLSGPFVRTFMDLDDDDAAGGGEEVVPQPYAFAAVFGGACTAVKPCSWSGSGTTWMANRMQNAVQAFYLANRFRDHLAGAAIGFDGFKTADPVVVQTDDGASTGPNSAHLNNANMFTPPDGTSPVMQMYLWSGSGYRAVNGGDDASILYHEYTHGLSNRLIRDATGWGALNLPQAGAMGEGWSDWYAKDFLVGQFPDLDTAAVGDVHMGTYTDATPNTIRSQGLDCPVGAAAAACPGDGSAGPGGYTYGDFGKVGGGPEVHADGEIWAETLWDLRTAIDSSADAERLITQGMRLSPPEPSFLDARNAILAADEAAGGMFRNAIWTAFAARGMGFYASTTGADDIHPVEDFSPPPGLETPRGTIAGRITDGTGAPLGDAKVALGSLVAEAGADGRFTLDAVPARAYANLVVSAPGHDTARTPVTVVAGQTTTLDRTLRRNWAAQSGGASVSGSDEYAAFGCASLAAVDQHPGTAWSTDGPGPKSMTILLPETIDVDHFEVDPGAGCGDAPGAAAGTVRIETSVDNATWTTAATKTFVAADRHRMNVVAPAAGADDVRLVRVTILNPQASSQYLDMTEFAVYTDAATPTPTATATASASPTATPDPTASPTPEPTASPTPDPTAEPTASPTAEPTATATPLPTAAPTAVPTHAVTPAPTPVARPRFTLPATGKRSIRVTARCSVACPVSATLTVDAATARKLGTPRTAGKLKRTLKAGSTTFAVTLAARARWSKVSRIKATLTVRSGSVVERRRVTIRR